MYTCVRYLYSLSCVVIRDCPPCHFLSSPTVLAELQQANLISRQDCEEVKDISDVLEVQRGKSPQVQSKTADILRSQKWDKEAGLLSGKQT